MDAELAATFASDPFRIRLSAGASQRRKQPARKAKKAKKAKKARKPYSPRKKRQTKRRSPRRTKPTPPPPPQDEDDDETVILETGPEDMQADATQSDLDIDKEDETIDTFLTLQPPGMSYNVAYPCESACHPQDKDHNAPWCTTKEHGFLFWKKDWEPCVPDDVLTKGKGISVDPSRPCVDACHEGVCHDEYGEEQDCMGTTAVLRMLQSYTQRIKRDFGTLVKRVQKASKGFQAARTALQKTSRDVGKAQQALHMTFERVQGIVPQAIDSFQFINHRLVVQEGQYSLRRLTGYSMQMVMMIVRQSLLAVYNVINASLAFFETPLSTKHQRAVVEAHGNMRRIHKVAASIHLEHEEAPWSEMMERMVGTLSGRLVSVGLSWGAFWSFFLMGAALVTYRMYTGDTNFTNAQGMQENLRLFQFNAAEEATGKGKGWIPWTLSWGRIQDALTIACVMFFDDNMKVAKVLRSITLHRWITRHVLFDMDNSAIKRWILRKLGRAPEVVPWTRARLRKGIIRHTLELAARAMIFAGVTSLVDTLGRWACQFLRWLNRDVITIADVAGGIPIYDTKFQTEILRVGSSLSFDVFGGFTSPPEDVVWNAMARNMGVSAFELMNRRGRSEVRRQLRDPAWWDAAKFGPFKYQWDNVEDAKTKIQMALEKEKEDKVKTKEARKNAQENFKRQQENASPGSAKQVVELGEWATSHAKKLGETDPRMVHIIRHFRQELRSFSLSSHLFEASGLTSAPAAAMNDGDEERKMVVALKSTSEQAIVSSVVQHLSLMQAQAFSILTDSEHSRESMAVALSNAVQSTQVSTALKAMRQANSQQLAVIAVVILSDAGDIRTMCQNLLTNIQLMQEIGDHIIRNEHDDSLHISQPVADRALVLVDEVSNSLKQQLLAFEIILAAQDMCQASNTTQEHEVCTAMSLMHVFEETDGGSQAQIDVVAGIEQYVFDGGRSAQQGVLSDANAAVKQCMFNTTSYSSMGNDISEVLVRNAFNEHHARMYAMLTNGTSSVQEEATFSNVKPQEYRDAQHVASPRQSLNVMYNDAKKVEELWRTVWEAEEDREIGVEIDWGTSEQLFAMESVLTFLNGSEPSDSWFSNSAIRSSLDAHFTPEGIKRMAKKIYEVIAKRHEKSKGSPDFNSLVQRDMQYIATRFLNDPHGSLVDDMSMFGFEGDDGKHIEYATEAVLSAFRTTSS